MSLCLSAMLLRYMGAIKEKPHASLTLASDGGGLSVSRIGHFTVRRRAPIPNSPRIQLCMRLSGRQIQNGYGGKQWSSRPCKKSYRGHRASSQLLCWLCASVRNIKSGQPNKGERSQSQVQLKCPVSILQQYSL
jgi:hypothetical protein